VYFAETLRAYKSRDGGENIFRAFRGAPGGDDYHALWIDPDEPTAHGAEQRSRHARDTQRRLRTWELLVQPAEPDSFIM